MKTSPKHQGADDSFLPGDILGRFACLLIGAFFATIGGAALLGFAAQPFQRRLLLAYELSLCAVAFGVSVGLWGLFAPRWIEALARRVAAHSLLILLIVLGRFAVEALLVLWGGKV